jgi:hypothetical protein
MTNDVVASGDDFDEDSSVGSLGLGGLKQE